LYSVGMLAIALCAVLAAPQLQETITVSRVVVDARVTQHDGEPVTDLVSSDFDVRIAGKKAVVESVEWIPDTVGGWQLAVDGSTPALDASSDSRQPPTANRQPIRHIILFVQTDFARNNWRTQGHMKFLMYADELLATFEPEDRIAVLSFDSHLKFRLDFSTDRAAIRDALRQTIFVDEPPPPPVVPSPSLAAHLDRKAMRKAAESETGLLLVANAIRSIPGTKTILLLGWGLGQRTAAGVSMRRRWKETRAALDEARVSLFALDTTDADYHDLQIGLIAAAEQTGGFYAKTHLFPHLAIERLQRTLSGHYELTLRAGEELEPGAQELTVRVKRRGATVLAPTTVLIRR
jgi:VWFA-related protein